MDKKFVPEFEWKQFMKFIDGLRELDKLIRIDIKGTDTPTAKFSNLSTIDRLFVQKNVLQWG